MKQKRHLDGNWVVQLTVPLVTHVQIKEGMCAIFAQQQWALCAALILDNGHYVLYPLCNSFKERKLSMPLPLLFKLLIPDRLLSVPLVLRYIRAAWSSCLGIGKDGR